MVERTSRVSSAIRLIAIAAAGITTWAMPPRPDVGKSPHETAKSRIIMMASQKFGTDWPTSATAMASKSIGPPRRIAASTPSGTASAMASSIAVTVSWKVAGRRAAISGKDGWPCRSEFPKSPWTARFKNRQYCTKSGSSKPHSARNFAICAAVAPGGSMISAGSPVRNVRTNETTDTPRMTRTAAASRRAIYARTSPFELQRIEPLRLVRTRRVVHPGAHPERGVGLVEEDERRLVSEKLLHVAVLRRALLRVVGGFDARQHLVEPGVLVVHAEPTLREPADHPRGLEIRVADAVDEEGRRLILHPARPEG